MKQGSEDADMSETSMVLENSLRAPHDARVALRKLLRGLHPSILADAELVLSELVTNVVRHTDTGGSVRLICGPETVRMEVSDRGRRLPVIRADTPGRVDGRGLRVVDVLATAWGVEERADGKTTWAELRTNDAGAG